MIAAYYRKMNLINLAVGVYLILAGLFMEISDTLFFVSIAIIVVIPILIARQSKGYTDVKSTRRDVFKNRGYLVWISILVIFIAPAILTLIVHKQLKLDYNNLGFVYIGLSGWFNALFNGFTLPLYKAHKGKTFD